jgi:MerR family mercuric resistance operon transcriptional regulator
MQGEAVTISQLAASADVHVETVRYYQRRGLLREPPRPLGGIRRYGAEDIGRLQFIRRAQTMGFSLDEIAGLLEIRGRQACAQTRQLTELKLTEVRRRLSELQQLEQDLLGLVADCAQVGSGDCCPTLELLEHAGSHAFVMPAPGRRAKVSPRRHQRKD